MASGQAEANNLLAQKSSSTAHKNIFCYTGPQPVLWISSNILSQKKLHLPIMQVKDRIWTGLQKFREISCPRLFKRWIMLSKGNITHYAVDSTICWQLNEVQTKKTVLLWNNAFLVKTSQSAKNLPDLAKNENRPKKQIIYCTLFLIAICPVDIQCTKGYLPFAQLGPGLLHITFMALPTVRIPPYSW